MVPAPPRSQAHARQRLQFLPALGICVGRVLAHSAHETFSLVWLAATQVGAQPREPHRYFKDVIGLSDAEIRQVEQGRVVAKVLATPLDHEVTIFGAVWVQATTDDEQDGLTALQPS